MIDYLDTDVAYLLGLIVTRGQIVDEPPVRRLVITLPFRSLIASGDKVQFEQKTQLRLGSAEISDRLSEVLGAHMNVTAAAKRKTLSALFPTNSIAWRDLTLLLEGRKSYREFQIPPNVLDAPADIQKDFMRGVVDGSGWIVPGTYYRSRTRGKRRVFIAIDNANWVLPVQLCAFLQQKLKVPVGEILWGHPNLRDPHCRSPKTVSFREHQVRVFCESFEKVGFYLDHKNAILAEFAAEDSARDLPRSISFHYLGKKHRKNLKHKHPQELSRKLPSVIRGKHYDYFWQICRDMGCQQTSPPAE
ncbi:MAG: hypothetical protein HY673_15605 [Chloroflexi bacterium]|nr:hypothetical protein [Chloroflexota bacterium]